MKELLLKTAWQMTPPLPYSLFHIGISLAGLASAFPAAFFLSRKIKEKTFYRILICCGAVLTASEVYKQLFLYYVVNNETYDWWYFPFQLCSLPMYFCLLVPFFKRTKMKTVILTFLQDFTLLGGIMALIEPSGLMHSYWVLTLHGLIWHILLIFIGLLTAFCRQSDRSLKGYFWTLPVFGLCCLIASFINVATHTFGTANMFYISPYYPSTQIVFHQIAVKSGVLTGNIAYLFSACLGGLICHLIFRPDTE